MEENAESWKKGVVRERLLISEQLPEATNRRPTHAATNIIAVHFKHDHMHEAHLRKRYRERPLEDRNKMLQYTEMAEIWNDHYAN